MKKLICIFVLGLVGISYPMKGEVTTPALSFISHGNKIVTIMQEEIWKDIDGYENYMVSSIGRVKSKERIAKHMFGTAKRKSVILKTHISKSIGYDVAMLYKDGVGKNHFIHRLVAQAFIPNPENKPTVNHINSIRHDNRVENLEWNTYQENIIHGYKYGKIVPHPQWKGKYGKDHFASKTIVQYKDDGEIVNEYIGICYASRETGIAQASISKCCIGQLQHAGGYKWKYKV